jgi:hypothetical protein
MTNALFNDNRLKLGVFGLNVSNGCAATTAEGHLQPTWQNNLDIAESCDVLPIVFSLLNQDVADPYVV